MLQLIGELCCLISLDFREDRSKAEIYLTLGKILMK